MFEFEFVPFLQLCLSYYVFSEFFYNVKMIIYFILNSIFANSFIIIYA